MPKSQTELCTRALKLILRVGAGQSASSEDVDAAQAQLVPLLAELSALGVCQVGVSEDVDALEIDDELYQGLATLLALDIGPEFGLPPASDEARVSAMKALRRITAQRPTYETLAVDYY